MDLKNPNRNYSDLYCDELVGRLCKLFYRKLWDRLEKLELAMAIIEGCAIADPGLIYLQGFYTLEGDSPFIFTADEELKKTTSQSIWVAPMRRVNIVVDRVVTIIQKVMDHSAIDKNKLQDEVDAAERNGADGKNTLDAIKVN